VDNFDTCARIHLVLDCRPGAWLTQKIAEGLRDTPAPHRLIRRCSDSSDWWR
jgi:hypothetical protein